jgi:thioredoxin:protein disulfide reductase
MVQRVVPTPLALALWGALLAGLALTFAHLAAQASSGARLLGPSIALVVGLWGGAMVLGAAVGGSDPWRPLAFVAATGSSAAGNASVAASTPFDTIRSPQMLQARLDTARANGQPVLVDFSADWCVSCHTIDREVFADPQVRQALAGVVLLRADVTAGDADQRALMREHQVLGPPTVMLFDAQGRERRDARLVGEFGVTDLLQRQPSAEAPSGKRS